MNTLITPNEINVAYIELYKATEAYQVAAIREIDDKAELDKAVAGGLLDGSINGKNEALRQAAAREALPQLHDDYEAAQQLALEAKHRLDLARIEVSRVRALLRLAELTETEEEAS